MKGFISVRVTKIPSNSNYTEYVKALNKHTSGTNISYFF